METARDRTAYLLKLGELVLKGGNRAAFEQILKRNIRDMLRLSGARIETAHGRFYIRCPAEDEPRVEGALRRLFGISGWAKTRIAGKTVEAVCAACVEEAALLFQSGARSFKINARRTDKSFPLDSYHIACEAADAISAAIPEFRVDVRNPQGSIAVEIRERAYVYGFSGRGAGGLPVGTAGRGLLLLSGGIDSPVAGYMMASRGMKIDAVHFHAYPYTSEEARQKAIRLAELVGRSSMGIRLYTAGYAAVQTRIKEKAPETWSTVLLRMAMMEGAEKIAKLRRSKCIITGESLSQVASQTIENIACAESRLTLPALRPLIGWDKGAIIKKAKEIGSYELSILPYQDCCALFSPAHPVLRGDKAEANRLYEALDLGELIERAVRESAVERCGFPE
ncbi:MAG: tRNA 4-thiouridine(8) synthase ThiI [Treponema sp.]|jgi:thiamine biosynthesis protein ThiI|nr:tRNA 4-thiouridine(8) synthase ThiI [Treponema sp.]